MGHTDIHSRSAFEVLNKIVRGVAPPTQTVDTLIARWQLAIYARFARKFTR